MTKKITTQITLAISPGTAIKCLFLRSSFRESIYRYRLVLSDLLTRTLESPLNNQIIHGTKVYAASKYAISFSLLWADAQREFLHQPNGKTIYYSTVLWIKIAPEF